MTVIYFLTPCRYINSLTVELEHLKMFSSTLKNLYKSQTNLEEMVLNLNDGITFKMCDVHVFKTHVCRIFEFQQQKMKIKENKKKLFFI